MNVGIYYSCLYIYKYGFTHFIHLGSEEYYSENENKNFQWVLNDKSTSI